MNDPRMEQAWHDPKLANVIYHDWEASTYDDKWSISYDERCIDYARDRYVHVAGDSGWPCGRVLEVGAGSRQRLWSPTSARAWWRSPSATARNWAWT